MTKTELLLEAKRRYPVNTIVKSLVKTVEYIQPITHKVNLNLKEEIWFESCNGKYNIKVYSNGEWAKIISKLKKIIQIY